MTCETCGYETAEGSESCLFCWYTGRYFESVLLSELRACLLGRIRALQHVQRAEVWHHGSGLFALAIELDDGRLMFPGLPVELDDVKGTLPGIPAVGGKWRVAVADKTTEEVVNLPDDVDDEGLVRAVKELSELGAALA